MPKSNFLVYKETISYPKFRLFIVNISVNTLLTPKISQLKSMNKGQAINNGNRNNKGLPTEIRFISGGYRPSGLGTRLIPVDRMAGWQTKIY